MAKSAVASVCRSLLRSFACSHATSPLGLQNLSCPPHFLACWACSCLLATVYFACLTPVTYGNNTVSNMTAQASNVHKLPAAYAFHVLCWHPCHQETSWCHCQPLPPNLWPPSSPQPFPCALLTKVCIAYGCSAGTRLAKTAEAIGMHVMGLNSKSSSAQLTSLLQQADVVSLHCPLMPTTHNLIG